MTAEWAGGRTLGWGAGLGNQHLRKLAESYQRLMSQAPDAESTAGSSVWSPAPAAAALNPPVASAALGLGQAADAAAPSAAAVVAAAVPALGQASIAQPSRAALVVSGTGGRGLGPVGGEAAAREEPAWVRGGESGHVAGGARGGSRGGAAVRSLWCGTRLRFEAGELAPDAHPPQPTPPWFSSLEAGGGSDAQGEEGGGMAEQCEIRESYRRALTQEPDLITTSTETSSEASSPSRPATPALNISQHLDSRALPNPHGTSPGHAPAAFARHVSAPRATG